MDDFAMLDKFHNTGTDDSKRNKDISVHRTEENTAGDGKAKWQVQLNKVFRTENADVPVAFMLQAVNSVAMTEADKTRTIDYIIASICEMDPKNSIEAMLAAQMVSVNMQSMEMMRLASRCTFSDTCRKYLSLASQLMRLYSHQAETFRKLRNNGRQQIRVEHVNINGGQNIVGALTQNYDRGVNT